MMSDMAACLNDLSYIPPNNEQNEPTQGDMDETSNKPTQAIRNEFEELYASSNEELYMGCDYVARLDFMTKFTYFKVKVYNTSRWKDSNIPGKKVPKKMLRYFLIIPILQRLYKSSHTINEMTWHATGKCTEPGKMQHPVDGRAFLQHVTGDTDNIQSAFVVMYEREPLIDDLKDLWAKPGVETIDVATGQKFNMRAMVLWTINDFSTRNSLSGWSGQDVAKPIIELCLFFKQIYSQTLMEDNMLKAQSKVVDIMCNLEFIYPPGFFDIMIHLVIYLNLEALEGGPILPSMNVAQLKTAAFVRLVRTKKCIMVGLKKSSSFRIYRSKQCCSELSEDDPDIIHVDNSSDLALTTRLNDLEIAALHIDGQSIDVDAPQDIIDVDEDDDIINDEDVLPYDLADLMMKTSSMLMMMMM
nr:hypothetical protein [Tanacetum cinerariifolium]